jgi:hypothetical protein
MIYINNDGALKSSKRISFFTNVDLLKSLTIEELTKCKEQFEKACPVEF